MRRWVTVIVEPGNSGSLMTIIKEKALLFGSGLRCRNRFFPALCITAILSIPVDSWPQGNPPGPEIRKTDDGVSYVSAGIGYDSRINLPRFSLRLVFATKTRKYLANVDVEISPGPSGKPIRIHSPGPWLHVDLPPGRYKLKARTAKGQEVVRTLEIRKNQITEVTVAWEVSDRED